MIHIDSAVIHVHGPTVEDIRTAVAAELAAALTPMEDRIMSAITDLKATVVDFLADLTAKLAQLQASIDDANTETHLTVEDQAAFDEIKALVTAKDAELGDADGSENPPL